jgi:hypothetical protein
MIFSRDNLFKINHNIPEKVLLDFLVKLVTIDSLRRNHWFNYGAERFNMFEFKFWAITYFYFGISIKRIILQTHSRQGLHL